MKTKLMLLMLLISSRASACEFTREEIILEQIIRYRYADILDQSGLIARLSLNDKDPRPEFLKKINSKSTGFFAAYSDLKMAKKRKVFREFNLGEIETNADIFTVYATEGEFPPAYRCLKFQVQLIAGVYKVTGVEKTN